MSESENRGPKDAEADIEPAASQLEQGLRNCRTVLHNYRVLIEEEALRKAAADPEQEGGATE